MGDCSIFVPKKCLCYFPLRNGTIFVGIVGFCVMALVTIFMIIQVCLLRRVQNAYVMRHMYAMSVVACLYSFFMAMVHLWLIWGVLKKKPSIVLSWVVINIVWMIQTTTLLIVLLCIHTAEVVAVFWVTSFIFTIITIGIEIYTLVIVYAYWLELKKSQEQVPVTN